VTTAVETITRTKLMKNDMDERLSWIAEWMVQTCLLFGASPETAYLVAGHFIAGLRQEWIR
jgi:hypothetical protein